MTKNIEVEVRGPLSKEEFEKLHTFMKANAEFIENKNRLSIMYFRNFIPKDANEIKDDPVDLRVRITNKKAEIVMKYGLWGGTDSRKEFIFPITLENFENIIEFLKHLGWKLAVIYVINAITYKYEGIEFGVTEIKDYGYCYEAEILAETEEEISKRKEEILRACNKLGLKEYKGGEFEKQCNVINNKKELQINFEETNFNKIKDKFREFF